MKKLICSILCLAISLSYVTAQESLTDSTTTKLTAREKRKQRVASRNFHYNILGGPSYTPDFGFLIGGSALMTFRMNPSDSTQLRSVVPMSIAFMFNGGINIMSKPQLFFKGDKFRIFGKLAYKNTQENFYGVGYDTNRDYVRSDSTSQYRYSGVQINPWFLFRVAESNFFVGPQIDINYDRLTNPAKALHHPDYSASTVQQQYLQAGGNSHGYTNFNSGIGFMLSYDSRDIPANAYQGIYFDLRGTMYQKWLGSDKQFYRLEADYRQYKSVGNRKVLAWTVQSKNVFGKDIPLTQYQLTRHTF